MPNVSARAALSSLAVVLAGAALAQVPAPAPPPPPATPAAPDITVTGRTEVGPPIPGPSEFISPMGEPFRSDDKLSGAEHWFAQADKSGNGRLTREEFEADALRFFAVVDTDHDGEICPAELQHYEVDIAPEVTVTSTYGDVSKATVDSDGKLVDPPYPTRLGAGRYGFLAAPEPIASADQNFDRGVTRQEFLQAAQKRFKMLDANGDGVLTRNELPKLLSPRLNR